jgi:hypothetical protein
MVIEEGTYRKFKGRQTRSNTIDIDEDYQKERNINGMERIRIEGIHQNR